MSSRQERFNQKKKKMDQALHGSEIEFDEPVEPKKNKQQESMDNALLDLKIAGEEYCQAIQESVEAEAKEEEEFSSFAKGRSVFELFLYNWAREDRWMIQAYIIITLLIPVGLVWWKIENKACGIFMFLFLGLISWVLIALLSPFVEFFIESLIKSNIVWHQVRLKSYNPLGSIVIGLLNLVNWFFAKGSFVLVFLLGAFLPFLNSIDRTEEYLKLFAMVMPFCLFAVFFLSYFWKCIYSLIARITLGIAGVGNKYRLVYLWDNNKVFKKSF